MGRTARGLGASARVLEAIATYYATHDDHPSWRDISSLSGKACGGGIAWHLHKLERLGYIELHPRVKGIRLLGHVPSPRATPVPMLPPPSTPVVFPHL